MNYPKHLFFLKVFRILRSVWQAVERIFCRDPNFFAVVLFVSNSPRHSINTASIATTILPSLVVFLLSVGCECLRQLTGEGWSQIRRQKKRMSLFSYILALRCKPSGQTDWSTLALECTGASLYLSSSIYLPLLYTQSAALHKKMCIWDPRKEETGYVGFSSSNLYGLNCQFLFCSLIKCTSL